MSRSSNFPGQKIKNEKEKLENRVLRMVKARVLKIFKSDKREKKMKEDIKIVKLVEEEVPPIGIQSTLI